MWLPGKMNAIDAENGLIETERMILRSMTKSDLPAIFRIFSDENVLAAFSLSTFDIEQMKTWIDRNLIHQKNYGYGLFSVILKSNEELIGDCGLEHTEFEGKPCVEIGYDFSSKYWNHGYATEAALAVKTYALNSLNLNLDSICSFIRKNNLASQRVSEKIGMRKIKGYISHDIDYSIFAFSKNLFK
jgi:RimJ/RimL family protein N-acetyltransferase